MALTINVNCGFVTSAPTDDPLGNTNITMDAFCRGMRDTAPVGAGKVTEIGWYCENATEEANFEVAIYSDDSDMPKNFVGSASTTNAKGTTAGWKKATGLNIPITAGTKYWICVQLDDTATTTQTSYTNDGAQKACYTGGGKTALDNPWTGGTNQDSMKPIYAIYGALAPPDKVTNPSPLDTSIDQAITSDCSWDAAATATSYDVYFGTSSPPASIGNQAGTTYDPSTLLNSTTYYWRIDSKNSDGTTTGDEWTFTTISAPATSSISITSLGGGGWYYLDKPKPQSKSKKEPINPVNERENRLKMKMYLADPNIKWGNG